MNPILQSASELRQSLLSLHSQLEDEQRGWDDMVLVGHSMGGMISRLMITSSKGQFDGVKSELQDVAGVDQEFSEYVDILADFKALPFVDRAVFIGAPHRGAKMANNPMGAAGRGIIRRPEYIRSFIEEKDGRKERMASLGNSILNLSPESSLCQSLGESRWTPGVPAHSIIGDQRKAGMKNGSDGVVEYWSSHVEGVESELIVKAGHLEVHKEIPAIAEVRRILLLHLRGNHKR